MSEDRERVLQMALKAVLVSAQALCIDMDELAEVAFQSMLNEPGHDADDVAAASSAIEATADALPVIE
jgi:hypothetical protein